jgi:hypothetical protein
MRGHAERLGLVYQDATPVATNWSSHAGKFIKVNAERLPNRIQIPTLARGKSPAVSAPSHHLTPIGEAEAVSTSGIPRIQGSGKPSVKFHERYNLELSFPCSEERVDARRARGDKVDTTRSAFIRPGLASM